VTVNIEEPKEMQGKVSFGSHPEAKGSTWSMIPIATNTGPDNYGWIGIAHAPDAAVMERIDSPAPPPTGYGPAFLVVKGLTANLDGFHLRNTIFQDMVLIYHGGPLILDDVYFVDCKFQLDPTVNSQQLISAVAQGGWVSFSSVSQSSDSKD
jgi:hypothetical protein